MLKTDKKKLTTSEKRVIIIMAITAVVAACIFGVVTWINDFYSATEKAKKAILGSETILVTETKEYYVFEKREAISQVLPAEGRGVIFYPGGKVDEVAYAPLMLELAEMGYEVYLVKMPAKLAIFGMNAADGIIKDATEITDWTIMGHSLGGAMAASYAAAHDEEIDNLVLLAAYSTEDLNGLDMDVYSFYGSEDKVLNMEKYESYLANLSEDMIETVIEGGNHAYYGHYGEQDGDGTATITRDEQEQTVLDIFLSRELGLNLQ